MTGRSPRDGVSGFASVGHAQRLQESSMACGGAIRKASRHKVSAGPFKRRRPTTSAAAMPRAKSSRTGNNARSARSPFARSPRACSRACRQAPACPAQRSAASARPSRRAGSLWPGLRGSRANRNPTRSCDNPCVTGCPATAAQACPSRVASAGIPCVKCTEALPRAERTRNASSHAASRGGRK